MSVNFYLIMMTVDFSELKLTALKTILNPHFLQLIAVSLRVSVIVSAYQNDTARTWHRSHEAKEKFVWRAYL